MLQQTQVPRVIPKYGAFLERFPDCAALASAPVAEVVRSWQGLGYNRRALALHRAADIIVSKHGGQVPSDPAELLRLPGVGVATVGSVCAFAYDRALPFIETNIRAAFIHFFFQGCGSVRDADILPLVEATLDHEHPRDWYYALMDYGVSVKKAHRNPCRRSRHHSVQSRFIGSRRQLRAKILRVLLEAGPSGMTPDDIAANTARTRSAHQGAASPAEVMFSPPDVAAALDALTDEGFLVVNEGRYRFA